MYSIPPSVPLAPWSSHEYLVRTTCHTVWPTHHAIWLTHRAMCRTCRSMWPTSHTLQPIQLPLQLSLHSQQILETLPSVLSFSRGKKPFFSKSLQKMVQYPKKQKIFLSLSRGGSDPKVIKITFFKPSLNDSLKMIDSHTYNQGMLLIFDNDLKRP